MKQFSYTVSPNRTFLKDIDDSKLQNAQIALFELYDKHPNSIAVKIFGPRGEMVSDHTTWPLIIKMPC